MNTLQIIKKTILLFARAWQVKDNDFSKRTLKRCLFLIIAMPVFLLWQLFNGLCFWLDDIFYTNYSKVEIQKALFIIGPTRSGTTFLFRTLAMDIERFTAMQLWEILFAPAIIQKKFWIGLGKLDELLGAPLARILKSAENTFFKKMNQMHRTSLWLPEEDALVWMHQFSSLYLYLLFPNSDYFKRFGQFDAVLSAKEKKEHFDFYKKCLQKHLFVFGKGRRMLSKSPVLSSKTQSVLKYFPDATLLFMKRDPARVVPSSLSFYYYLASQFSSLHSKKTIYARTSTFLMFWASHTIDIKERQNEARIQIIDFNYLTKAPQNCIREILEREGSKLNSDFDKVLTFKEKESKQYKSRHQYSLQEFGLTKEGIQILNTYDNCVRP